ncbi:hypothetical protein C8Q79DRAFT_1014399 [Trametes meyenii]|nr:hypothetical protein C8Q79DRAFT_1014399 [Trametes meyenii]
MCVGENLAPFAAYYLNAQLAALYENSERCVAEHPDAQSEGNHRFSALAKFVTGDVAGQSYSVFTAIFDKPEVKFICNHNAILKLKIRSIRGPLELDDVFVNILVPFLSQTSELLTPAHFGHMVQFDILNLDYAAILSISAQEDGSEPIVVGRTLLERYLVKYLKVLQEAKLDTFFALPQTYLKAESDDHVESRSPHAIFDHALASHSSQIRMSSFGGVTVEKINEHIFSAWLACSMSKAPEGSDRFADWEARCLVEYRFWDSSSECLHFEFEAPYVEILCPEEMVIIFHIKKVQVLKDGGSEAEYTNWKIGFLVYTMWTTDESGIKVEIDFSRGYHHHPSLLAVHVEEGQDATLYIEHQQRVVDILDGHYIEILQRFGFGTLYSHDTRWERSGGGPEPEVPEYPAGIWGNAEVDDASKEGIQRAGLGAFDQVTAISQESINSYLATLYEKASSIFKTWAYGNSFNATFKRPQLRILSDKRAILWIHIKEGSFVTLDGSELPPLDEISETCKRTANGSRLAFEIKIRMVSHHQLEPDSVEAVQKQPAFAEHGGKLDCEVKHITLDFDCSQYVHKYSTINVEGGTTQGLQSLLVYISKAYFEALRKEGLHVIASIPTWPTGRNAPPHAMTTVDFRIHCDREVNRDNWASVTTYPPVLLILGVLGSKDMPSEDLSPSTTFIPRLRDPRLGFSHGTVAVAKQAFMERAVLGPLARVNALTTLIPEKSALLPGSRPLKLKTWFAIAREDDQSFPTTWCCQPPDEYGFLKYLWSHRAELTYRYETSCNRYIRDQRIVCHTENWLTVPTAVGQGPPLIQIDGKMELSMCSTETPKEYETPDEVSEDVKALLLTRSARASVRWGLTFTIDAEGSIIKVKACETATNPKYALEESARDAAYSGDNVEDPEYLLRGAFPASIDITDVLSGVDQTNMTAEGAWAFLYPSGGAYRLGTPAFNANGDLVLELCRMGSPPNATKPSGSSARNGLKFAGASALLSKMKAPHSAA